MSARPQDDPVLTRFRAALDETGEFIHAMPYRAGSYDDERNAADVVAQKSYVLESKVRCSVL
jgi:hypothetical protein